MIRACLLVLAGGITAEHNRVLLSSDHCHVFFVAAAILF